MSLQTRRLLASIAAALWAAAIFYVSSRPGSTLPGGFSVEGHLGEYAVLGVLLTLALGERRIDLATVALAVLVASLYGVSDEYHQHFVVLRTPDVVDWVLDTVGASAGALGLYAVSLRRSRTPAETDAERS